MKDIGSCWVCGSWWWSGLLKAVLGTRHCQNAPLLPVNPKPQPRDGSPLIHDQNAQTQTSLNLNLRTRYIVASRFGAGAGLRIVLGEGVVVWGRGARLAGVRTSRGMGDSRRCRGRIGSLLVSEDMFIFKLSRIVDRVLKVWSCREGRVFGPQESV
jgi:hypothetical protein